MAVELTAKWWKSAKPKTLDTKTLDKAFDDLEHAKAADEGRRNVHKVAVPDALRSLIKVADSTNDQANKITHAQTKKNLTEVAVVAKSEIARREDALKTLIKATDVLKIEAQKIVHLLPAVITNVEGVGIAGSAGISTGGSPDQVKHELAAEIVQMVQSMTSTAGHCRNIKALSSMLEAFPLEIQQLSARLLTSVDGIEGAFKAITKAVAAGSFATVTKIANAELKAAPEKIVQHIREW